MGKESNTSITKKEVDPNNLQEIHKLLKSITKITTHIESQNETIIQANRKLRDENINLEHQLKALIEKNTSLNSEVEILIDQNKEFRESLYQCRIENLKLQDELEKQNNKMRVVIETLKTENLKLRLEVDEGVKLLRWSSPEDERKRTSNYKKKRNPWRNLCPMSQSPSY